MADDFKFSKLNRNSTWKDIFDTIDDNFSKVSEYLATTGNKVQIDRFTAKAGQTDFTLTYDYNTAQNSLIVYVNGSRQFLTTGFTETSTNTFKLVTACSAGDQVVAVYNQYYTLNDPVATIKSEFNNADKVATSSKLSKTDVVLIYDGTDLKSVSLDVLKTFINKED